jgi:biotin carboxyl carrier protein
VSDGGRALVEALLRGFTAGELEISVRFRPVGPAPPPPPTDVTAPIAGAWIPAAGVRAGARVDVGAMVGTIAGAPIESKVAGIVARLLVDAGAQVALGQPLLALES